MAYPIAVSPLSLLGEKKIVDITVRMYQRLSLTPSCSKRPRMADKVLVSDMPKSLDASIFPPCQLFLFFANTARFHACASLFMILSIVSNHYNAFIHPLNILQHSISPYYTIADRNSVHDDQKAPTALLCKHEDICPPI